MNRTWVLVAVLAVALAVGLLLSGCRSGAAPASAAAPVAASAPAAPPAGEAQDPAEAGPEKSWAGTHPAPEFPEGLEWLNTDRPLRLAELRGKVVVLDFWTYGCINCIHNLPWLERLQADFPDELVVIGVHSAKFTQEGQTENIRNIILRYDIRHPVLNDNGFQVFGMWGAQAWPTLVIIDPAGNVVGGMSGEGFYPIFKPIVQSLVSEFGAQGALQRAGLGLRLEREGAARTLLSFPGKVLADGAGRRLFVSDTGHHRVIVAHMDTGVVLELIGGSRGFRDGDFRNAAFDGPQGLALSPEGTTLYVADTNNHAVRSVDLAGGAVSTLVGTGAQAAEYPPQAGTAPEVALSSPWDLELDGQQLFIAMAGSHQLWKLDLATGETRPLAGSGAEGFADGPLGEAELAQPSGLSLDRASGRLYFADSEGSTIRFADLRRGTVSTLAGSGKSLFEFGDRDGVGDQALLQHPLGVVHHRGRVYVADTYNSKIKAVDPQSGDVRTLFGAERGWRDGTEPLFYEPGGVDAWEGRLYVADTNNHSIRVIELSGGGAATLVLKDERALDRSFGLEGPGAGAATVRLPAAQASAGPGALRLEVELPAGYKVNDLAPSVFEWEVDGAAVELPAGNTRSLAGPAFPLDVEARFREGSATLALNMYLVYCEAEQDKICLIERVRFELPLRVVPGGGSREVAVVRVQHRVQGPRP